MRRFISMDAPFGQFWQSETTATVERTKVDNESMTGLYIPDDRKRATRSRRYRAGLPLLIMMMIPAIGFTQDPTLVQPIQLFEAAKAQGDFDNAILYGQQALELAEQQFGADGEELVDLLESLGEIHAAAGQYDEAIRFYRRSLAIREQALGADHPDLISTLDVLARATIDSGDLEGAESLLTRIIAIEQATFGSTHENVRISMNRLRDLYVLADRPDAIARIENDIEALEFRTRDVELSDSRRYDAKDGFATVRIFYGTNRAQTDDPKPAGLYGPDRGTLAVGYLDVSVPEIHKYGELETFSRWDIFSYRLGEDALKRKYVLLLDVQPLGRDDFREQFRSHVSDSPSNDVFVFIHGYNSSFEDAARRTAQLAYDLDFDGTPAMYSWPSQASTTSYTVDEAVVRLSGRKMADFLAEITDQTGAERVHLIAHSMGNRALLEALTTFDNDRDPALPVKAFDQIVFTAPDVDRDYFVEVIDSIKPLAERVTLYASANDVALRTSRLLHGAPRAGLDLVRRG